MAEQIVIEFIADTKGLEPAVDTLESLKQIDKSVADEFKKNNAVIQERLKLLGEQKQSTEKLGTSVEDLNTDLNELDQTMKKSDAAGKMQKFAEETEKVTTKTRSLKAQLKDLRQELALMEQAGQRNTAAYRKMRAEAGLLEDQMGDTAAQIRVMASDTRRLDAALSLASGVAGGFAVAQAGAALFGEENEDLQKSMLKVQAALSAVNGLMAISQTLQKDSAASVLIFGKAWQSLSRFITTSTGATKAFRIALISTGIGAFVVLLGGGR